VKPYGHIKISRKAFDPVDGDDWWQEPRVFSRWEAWVYLIQLAQWHPTTLYSKRFGTTDLARGEFVVSRRTLAKHFQWGEKQVRNFLRDAQNAARIRAQREAQAGTVYLIVNYDTYQAAPVQEGTPKGPADGHAGAQRGPKNKAVKQLKQLTTPSYPADFELLWSAYPKRSGSNNKQAAYRQFQARLAEDIAFDAMYDGTQRYAAWAQATGKVGTELVKMASTFLGRDQHFAEAWDVPSTNGSSPAQATAQRRDRPLTSDMIEW
jgi:hypothetical protein